MSVRIQIFSTMMLMLLLPAVAQEMKVMPGLSVNENGVLIRKEKPYRGIGVNCFNAFLRTLHNPEDTSYREGFKVLKEHGIPFVRFAAIGFWPKDCRLYFEDRKRYFELLDGVVKSAEENDIGLIPSVFWYPATVSDLVGEPRDQWGNPASKTHAFMRQYVHEIVSRYRNSPAIWGWEFGNEFNLSADLPNASEHRPAVVPALGTPTLRSKRDEVSHDMVRKAFAEFAKEVRKQDKHRVIISGNSIPRASAWHQKKELSWTQDTEEQYREMLLGDNPNPMNMLSIHYYSSNEKRFNREPSVEEILRISMDIANKARKPLFVGEFGSNEENGHQKAVEDFNRILAAIEKTGVPLAAMWVFDLTQQNGSFNVTATNNRSYQLQAVAAVNQRMTEQN